MRQWRDAPWKYGVLAGACAALVALGAVGLARRAELPHSAAPASVTPEQSEAEARWMLERIATAEENYRAETLSYLGCSKCSGAEPSHPDVACWRTLGVAQ